MIAWDRMRKRVEAGDAEQTAALVLTLTAEERREVAKELPGYLRRRLDTAQWRILDQRAVAPLLVAGLGCLGGAAGATSWLFRPPLRVWSGAWSGPQRPDHLLLLTRVIAERPAEWRLDLARRIAARLRPANLPWREGTLWRLAAQILTDVAEEPPADDAFVLGWLQCGDGPAGLRTDPFLDTLAPRIFEADGAGRVLYSGSAMGARSGGHTWEGELSALAAEGRIKREMLLDGCLSRFLRGGSANDLKWFATLHDALAPTLEEVGAHTRDYLRLVPAAPAPIAMVALREIRRLDEAGGLDDAAFAEAAEALLFRPEKKLLRTALSWLGRTASGRADATLRALTVAFDHEALDLRERAVKLVTKHAPKASEETLRAVRDSAATLPGDLRELIAAACGAVEADEPAPEPIGVAPPVPREQPPAIGSVAELAEESAALLRAGEVSWQQGERLLAGLTTFAYRDPEGTRTALARIIHESDAWLINEEFSAAAHPKYWLGSAIGAALRRPAPRPASGLRAMLARAYETIRTPAPGTYDERVRTPQWVLHQRMREAIGLIGRVPVLLSTPTAGNGGLDPHELVSRLEILEAAGINAATADLEHALLRLPRTADPDAAARARKLSSPAGRIAAGLIESGGIPDPDVTTSVLTLPRLTYVGYPTNQSRDVDVIRVLATVSADGLSGTAGELCRLPSDGPWKRADYARVYGSSDWWPAMMPSHREVIAAHLLPEMEGLTDELYGQGTALLGLAEADGPPGDALATVLAYGLASRRQKERSAGVDALLILAGRGQLPAVELGTAIGRLADHKLVKLNRVTAALSDATDAGAHAEVGTTILTALPDVLPEAGSPARAGLPDLLALAGRCAEATGVRADVPVLAAVAGRGGSSRVVREAARLHRLVASV